MASQGERDHIELTVPEIPVFMGCAGKERVEPQPIRVTMRIHFDARRGARSGNLADVVDYVRVLGETRFLLWTGRFFLIETAAEALARYLLSPHDGGWPVIDAISLRLEKPRALGGVAFPALVVSRSREDFRYAPQEGDQQLIDDNPDCRIFRVSLPPGGSFAPAGRGLAGMALDPGLRLGDAPVVAGAVEYFTQSPGPRYENTGDRAAHVLFVECRDPQWSSETLRKGCLGQHEAAASFYDPVLRTYVSRDSEC